MAFLQVERVGMVNIDKLREEAAALWGAAFKDANEHEEGGQAFIRFYFSEGAAASQQGAQALIAAHNASMLTEAQKIYQQQSAARNAAGTLLAGLYMQSVRDAAYAVVARSYAAAVNEAPEVIAQIIDRNSATAYIAGTAWWGALNSVQRQYKMIDLEAEAIRTQAMIAGMR